MAAASAAARWKAVAARDASNNTFVYAVRSTRIYARPSCPARLARRANVEFFDTPAQAESVGYRACKRCQPDVDVKDDPQSRLVQQARDTIDAAMVSSSLTGGRRPRLRELAANANLTPSHFHRVFKKIAGVTPAQYARVMRDTMKAGKEADLSDITGMSDALFLQDVDGFNHWVDPCQAQVDAAIIPDIDFTMDDLIDWNHFDETMINVKESDALNLALGA
ncbi:hypothetical protein B0A54_17853 [Friedmanniomyces endolithicus]|uniref:HTH araC/xylS-type domain-containing protein n=1 Tax=Friedmanniomyces endolithicus TaxID=329885 RepID=A0A4U0TRG4_9PEZI|nr:hypothetical protein LTS09_017731 [Friedmanniomyces endolithicus]TKA24657.1 hypothetical protein B0A54_17853 [Friedmanniomyces endolithicus]